MWTISFSTICHMITFSKYMDTFIMKRMNTPKIEFTDIFIRLVAAGGSMEAKAATLFGNLDQV